jgi:putative inorganic carbon (HCO3(-)) transporter
MIFVVLVVSALLLSSVISIGLNSFLLVLVVIFIATGLLARSNIFFTYLVVSFLLPLLPSQPQQLSLPGFNLYEFLFLCFAFWWSCRKIVAQEFQFRNSPLNLTLAILACFCVISAVSALLYNHLILNSIFLLKLKDHWNVFLPWEPAGDLATVRALISFLEGILYFFITLDVLSTKARALTAFKATFYSAAIVSILGVLQYLFRFHLLEFWVKQDPNLIRINSTFDDPNALGTYLAAVLCATAFPYLWNSPKAGKFYSIGIAVIVAALFMTSSRAALGSALLVLFLMPVIVRQMGFDVARHVRGFRRVIARYGPLSLMGLLLLVVVLAVVVDYRDPKPQSLSDVVMGTLNPNLPLNETLKGRINLWQTAFDVIKDRPLFGCGIGNFLSLITRHENDFPDLVVPENAHNFFLQLIAEVGIVGFLLSVPVIYKAFHAGIVDLRRETNTTNAVVVYGLLCGITVVLLTSLTGHPLLLLKMQFVFWNLIGILLALTQHNSVAPVPLRKNSLSLHMIAGLALLFCALWQIGSALKTRDIAAYEYGFYDWEQDAQGELFRWTKGEAASSLELQGKVLRLRIRELNPDVLKRHSYADVFIDGVPVDTVEFQNTDWKELSYYLPHLHWRKRIDLKIKTSTLFYPAHHGMNDVRALGIAMQPFSWSCCLEKPVGTYAEENQEGHPYRWTREEAYFPLQPEGTKLKFPVLPNPTVEKEPLELKFFWNDELIDTIQLKKPAWQTVELDLPETSINGGVLGVKVSKTWNPRQMGVSNDSRQLGIGLGAFEWAKTDENKSVLEKHEYTLKSPRLYAISRTRNGSFRWLIFPFDASDPTGAQPSNWEVYRNGNILPFRSELADCFRKQRPEILTESFVLTGLNQLVRTTSIASPSLWIRITAKGSFSGNEFPVLGIKINGRSVAKQSVQSAEWQDYFLEVPVKIGTNEITFSLLNDYYDAKTQLDRNIFINEIICWPNIRAQHEIEPGWDFIKPSQSLVHPGDPSSTVFLFGENQALTAESYWKPGIVSLMVTARATFAGNDFPVLGIYLDKKRIAGIEVTDPEFRRYIVGNLLIGGQERIEAILENDYFDPKTGADRNIFVREVSVKYQNALIVAEPIRDEFVPRNYCYLVQRKESPKKLP